MNTQDNTDTTAQPNSLNKSDNLTDSKFDSKLNLAGQTTVKKHLGATGNKTVDETDKKVDEEVNTFADRNIRDKIYNLAEQDIHEFKDQEERKILIER